MNGEPEALVEYLPQVRCTAVLKRRLERVAQRSVTRNLADHIRFAVEMYVAAEEGRQEVLAETATGEVRPASACAGR